MSNDNPNTNAPAHVDVNAGMGGTYTIDPATQTRALVQRTVDSIPVDESKVPPAAPPDSAS